MDKITISDLIVPAIIGVEAHEQISHQLLSLTLSIAVNASHAASFDRLQDTIDYAGVRREILKFAEHTQCRLLETFADRLANHLKQQFQLSWLQLSITKRPYDMPDVEGVTVTIVRGVKSPPFIGASNVSEGV